MKKVLFSVFYLAFFLALLPAQNVTIPNPLNYPKPNDLSVQETAALGDLIPRTIDLLRRGKEVKFAIYGQSLSSDGNRWWIDLGDALKVAYPNAKIDVRTYGVGGLASNLLWRLTNQELVDFYPDLVVLHVFGNHLFYETIVRQIRGCTAAEMIIQGDHFASTDGTGTAGSWDFDLSNMSNWENYMSFNVVKGYCDKYQLERDNRRQEWYDYLRSNSYVPAMLLKDNIHFNEQGQWLAAALTARHFVEDSLRISDPNRLLKFYEVGKDVFVNNGLISLDFEGNRVEIVPTEKSNTTIFASVDGKKPSEFSNSYYYTIPAGGFWNGAPFLRPGMGAQQEEDWTITMKGSGNFQIKGSKTGDDGSGNKDNLFISKSKKIVFLNSSDWGNYGSPNTTGEYTFKSKGMFNDSIDFDSIAVNPTLENPIRIIQGVSNGKHNLVLTSSDGQFPIKFIKIYKPALKLYVTAPEVVVVGDAGGTANIPVSGNTFWQATHYSSRLGSLSKWNNVVQQGGSDLSLSDNVVNISCTVPPLSGVNSSEYIYIYGQGCDVKVVEIRQGNFSGLNQLAQNNANIILNQVTNQLSIKFNSVCDANVKVLDCSGKIFIVKDSKASDALDLTLGGLNAGVYFVVVSSKDRSFCRKIVKF